MSFLWIFFWGHAFSELFFWGSSIILSIFLGFAHFLGNLFISIKIRVAYTYVLQGHKIQFCMAGLVKFWKLDHDDVVWIASYTLRINKIFKFYPTWYLLPSSYIY